MGGRTGKYKLGARTGKYKLGARAGKYKFGARDGGRSRRPSKGPGAEKYNYPKFINLYFISYFKVSFKI